MLPDRLRHSPLLVLFPPVFLFVTGMAHTVLSGVELTPAAWLFGLLAVAVAVLLGTISGPMAIVIFYLTLVCALITFLPTVIEVMFGFSGVVSVLLALVLIVAVAYAVMRLRSPFRHRFSGEIFIEKPRAVVWDALFLQPTSNHWKPHVRKIEAVPGKADHFKQFHQSGVDQDADLAAPPTVIRRSNVTEGTSFTVETVEMPDNVVLDGATDQQTYLLEDAGEGTWVTTVEFLENIPLNILVLSALIRPCQDELRQLKLILEGSDDTTFASDFYQDEE